jgi:hypothetical protein
MTSKDDTTGEHRTTQGATEADGFHVYTLKVSKKAAKTGNKSTDLYEGFLASRHTFEEGCRLVSPPFHVLRFVGGWVCARNYGPNATG